MVHVAKIGLGIFICCIFSSCKKINTSFNEGPIFNFKQYNLDENGQIVNTEFSLSDFDPAINCRDCHLDHYQEWSESMHAYSMKDPIFFTGWDKSQDLFPETGERFCIQCHSPAAFLTGEDLTGFSSPGELMDAGFPPAITDGVSCDICHTITSFSETIHTQDDVSAVANSFHLNAGAGIKYGSIENPQANSYHESEYNPIYKRSELCLPCHDMTIRGVDAEITFTEWNDVTGLSMFAALSCQECHMPLTTRPAATGGPDRLVHSHKFIGVDLDLSIAAEDNPQYEDVLELLQNSVMLEFGTPMDTLTETVVPGDSFMIPLTITSLTAHSLPSGVSFAREAWLEIIVTDSTNNILFESGTTATNSSALDETDEDLLLFTSYLLDENGDVTGSVTDVHELKNNSLTAFGKRYYSYTINTSDQYFGEINIQVRMLFRSFKPNALAAHPDLLQNISIFEMEILTKTVSAQL